MIAKLFPLISLKPTERLLPSIELNEPIVFRNDFNKYPPPDNKVVVLKHHAFV